MKNIIIVNDYDYIQGGASKVAIQTANMLVQSDKDMNVYFFSAVHGDETILDKKVIKICTNQVEAIKNKNKLKGIIDGIYNVKAKKNFEKLLSTLNKDETVIHVHGWTKALSSSIFDIAFKKDFKVVLTLHDYFTACPNGGYFNYKKNKICQLKPLSWKCIKCNCDSRNYGVKLYRLVRQFVQNKIVRLNDKLTYVISISKFSEKILRKTVNKNTRICRVYNPIDLDTNPMQIDYKKNKYFLYVGRVSKEKGVDIFCEAITKTNQNGIVVGDGAELEKLKNKYTNIKFVGWKDSDEVKKYMQGARALIFPSRWYETAGLTVIESLSYGIPTIVASNTAAMEFIKNKNQIFENSNIESLIKIIQNEQFKPEKIDVDTLDNEKYLRKLNILYERNNKK